MPSVVMVALNRLFLPILRHGRAGILAIFARIPGEDQDVLGLVRSHDRMVSVATGSGNR